MVYREFIANFGGDFAVKRFMLSVSLGLSLSFASFAVAVDDPLKPKETEGGMRRVVKSDAEWAKILTREQYYVTRMKGTEPAFSGKYARYHGKGVFDCVGCDEPLFDARTKFESGTGWPSFYRPVAEQKIVTQADYSDGTERIEVNCATCGAHLGHVFGDGPAPTGLRFCINSASLKLEKPPATTPPKSKAKAADKAKSKVETKATPKSDTKTETPAAPKS